MSTAVQGNIKDLTGTAIITNCFVRFWLRGCNGNVPRVNGVALVAQKSGNEFYFDLVPNASGAISGTLYSNDVNISAGGQVGVTWYHVQVFTDGTGGAFIPYTLADGTTFDLTSATPITSTPVVANPTGDSTYARLDGGNTPFTAIIQFLQGLILGAGKILAWGSVGTGSVDTGISRTAAKTLAVGNGTQGDATGTLNAATYQVAGVAQSGTGPLAGTVSPAFTTPNIGVASGTSLALGGGTALATTNRTGTGNLVLATAPTVTNSTQDTINQPAATAFTIKDNQGGTRFSIPSGGVAQGQINNTSLTGANTANNVSVLNAQGATAPITGTAADVVIYTYTLPANTIDTTSKGVRISCAANHNSGTANPSVKININGVNVVTGSIGTAAGQSVNFEALILRTSTTAGGSKGMNTSGNALLPFSITLAGLAWTSAQIITFTFNVAATDQMTGIMFMVEQIQ